MRCRTCKKTIKIANKQHNREKQQCARCHYLGYNQPYPGGKTPKASNIFAEKVCILNGADNHAV